MNILIIAFVLFLNLQGQQTTTQVKNDVAMVSSAIISYQTNNRGNFPPANDVTSLVYKYVGDGSFSRSYMFKTNGDDAIGTMILHFGTKCDGSAIPRGYSISTLQDDSKRYCLDS